MNTSFLRIRRTFIAMGAAALLALGSIAAFAQAPAPAGPAEVPPVTNEADNVQEPLLEGSISIDDVDGMDEAAEQAELSAKAKISADDAKTAALNAVAGTVTEVELDNENGSVVYSVEIVDAAGTDTDVKVDAGNGSILDRQTDDGTDALEDDELDDGIDHRNEREGEFENDHQD